MRARTTTAVLPLLLVLGGAAGADEWDSNTQDDDSLSTSNALRHGSEQVHDLAAVGATADQDFSRIATEAYSSYQIVVDGLTGDVRMVPTDLQRLDFALTVVQSALSQDLGGVMNLTWIVANVPTTAFIRVKSAGCAASPCTSDDRYRIRFYETTYTIPRFNNTSTQTTVLLVQNLTDRPCTVLYHLDSAFGDFDEVQDFLAYGMRVVNTASIAPNQSGHVRIAHDCGYGGLSGKAVAIEPATGFTFDTAMVPRVD